MGGTKEKTRVSLDRNFGECQYFAMRKLAAALLLIATFSTPATANAVTAKAGATCTKLNATQVVGSKKFTCIKSGKKLVWNAGVTIPKVIVKKAQTIDFPELGNHYLKEARFTFTPGITTSGLPVSITGSGACAFDSKTSEIVLNSLGTCTVTASQPGDTNYLPAASIAHSFELLKISQTISAPIVPDQDLLKVNSYSFELPKLGNDAPFLIRSKDVSICSVEGLKVSLLQVGICSLTINKDGDGLFEAAKEVATTFKIFLSAQPGEKANPATLGREITKGGISVTVDAINEGVSSFICAADLANKDCVDKNGTGTFQATNNDRYIEILFAIVNNSAKTWVASSIYMQVDADHNYPKTTVYTIDSLDGLELEPGDGISGSYFILLPNSVDSSRTLISYGDGNEATTFYFKAR